MIKQVSDFMTWLGGGDPVVLKQVPQGRARFVQMAGILLTTASIAVLAMIFALHDGVKVPLFPALLLGLFWGVVILNIDRFLVLSMGTTRDRWQLLFMALPRLALAVVLSLVISTPLVLRVFASDINAQLYTTRLEQSKQQAQLEASSKEQKQLNQVQSQISADNAILSGHIPTVTSPQLQAAQAQVARLQPLAQTDFQKENSAYEAWQCELDGQDCAGSSGKSGNGPRAQAKQQLYQQAAAAYDSAETQLQQAQAAEQAAQAEVTQADPGVLARDQQQARQALTKLDQQRDQLEAYIQGESAYGTQVNAGRHRNSRAAAGAVAGQRPQLQPAGGTPGGPGAVLPHRDPACHREDPAQPGTAVRLRHRRQAHRRRTHRKSPRPPRGEAA